jgi:protein involved in polysaccharide export with SLBB domain
MKGGRAALVAVCLAVLSGCAGSRTQLSQALLNDRYPAAHARDLEARYVIHCFDVIDVSIPGLPTCSGQRAVGPDGYIFLGPGRAVRVDGLTVAQIAREISRAAGVPSEAIRVRVVEYRSQQLYLVGETQPEQQVVAYRGPETILDLLQRVRLDSSAALGDIRVVREHVADGKPAETFPVDLRAILYEHDLQSNIRLEPGDRVSVGSRRPSRLACCIPPWLKLLYDTLGDVK